MFGLLVVGLLMMLTRYSVAAITPTLIHHHQYYHPEPDFTPLVSLLPPPTQHHPSKNLPAPPSFQNFNYLYGNPSGYYSTNNNNPLLPTTQYQFPQHYVPTTQQQLPQQSLSSPSSSPYVISQQPTYSYTGALGNLGSMSLSSPVLSNYGSSYSSYLFPNNYQSYLYDPYTIQQQHQQRPLKPPFGFIEKQSRDPNDNPAHFVKNAPPKAVMTTATDLLGLKENHYYGDKSDESSLHRRKPTTMSFNHFYNTENNEFTYHGNQQKYGTTGSRNNHLNKKGLVTQLKVLNGTEIEVEPDHQEAKKPYVSEPILPPSILSLSTRWNDKEYDNFVNLEQPRNIVRNNKYIGKKHREAVDVDADEVNSNDGISFDVDKLMSDEQINNKDVYHCEDYQHYEYAMEPEVHADPVRCDQFYYCKNGNPFVFKCPLNRYFNPYMKTCELDADFACAMTLK